MNPIARYLHWLHDRWPAGAVEKAPHVNDDGTTRVPGLRVVGDLVGVPLLKFSAHTGARAVQEILRESAFKPSKQGFDYDLAIVGAGVAGVSAAIEAKKAGLNFLLLDASEPFSTIRNFPRGKPIYAYPTEMTPDGELRFKAKVKEGLLAELEQQAERHGIRSTTARIERVHRQADALVLKQANGPDISAQRVIVAIGRTGNYRKLGVPGENRENVYTRLVDAEPYAGQDVLVVGGGDSALEAAIALAEAGAKVALSYRKNSFARPKPENATRIETLAQDGSIRLLMASKVLSIHEDSASIQQPDGQAIQLPAAATFLLIGREAPLDFFRRSGVPISGDYNARFWLTMAAALALMTLFYHWQKGILFQSLGTGSIAWAIASLGGLLQTAVDTPTHFLNHLRGALNQPGFYYSLAYSACVVAFGIRRVKRRKTPYVRLQTTVLALFQIIPLFLLPWLLLPWAGANGWWADGIGGWIGDQFWPNGEYWRAFGLVLAWPLFVYNWFTPDPIWGWLILGFLQTFVLIPLKQIRPDYLTHSMA